ncbi:MAG: hypothetical protein KKC72_01930, partial [Alphaproteobacteria bacterium]|nr:hypothetical protein [Alphaproteobacteria bacterium]MBU1837649.1 hypothetical protein [Alphaproteobacteria bacterium]
SYSGTVSFPKPHGHGPFLSLDRGSVISGPYISWTGDISYEVARNSSGELRKGWHLVPLILGRNNYDYTMPFFTNEIGESDVKPLVGPGCL